jgi:hypothetical protein
MQETSILKFAGLNDPVLVASIKRRCCNITFESKRQKVHDG